jgi:hypothetical protein
MKRLPGLYTWNDTYFESRTSGKKDRNDLMWVKTWKSTGDGPPGSQRGIYIVLAANLERLDAGFELESYWVTKRRSDLMATIKTMKDLQLRRAIERVFKYAETHES